MTAEIHAVIRQFCQPALPLPTDEQPMLRPLADVRALLLDIYGTLVTSACGDVGTSVEQGQAEAADAALAAVGIECRCGGAQVARSLLEAIAAHHEAARQQGVEHPEVDIVRVWGDVLTALADRGHVPGDAISVDLRRLAVEYEVRTNPVWPMPHLIECLAAWRADGRRLGVVSNAQFFTPELFPALLGQTLDELGFCRSLQFYSYRFGEAKPGSSLYRRARAALANLNVGPDEVVYVGNDMLNDVAAAASVGFRTVLFAGDGRSLRRRRDDPRVAGVRPDVTVTDLRQLVECLA